MTTWTDVGRQIAPLAPALGGILGGFIPFPGGPLIGQKLGEIIAGRFGVEPTPAAVSDAVKRADTDLAIAKLNQATEQARIEVQGFVEAERQYYETVRVGITQVNETMRAELAAERHLFFTGWRPGAGWAFTLHAFLFGFVLLYAALRDPVLLERLSSAWPIYASFFGTLAAMVGVYVVARTADKINKVDTTAPPVKVKR